jgi:hypothetical protein
VSDEELFAQEMAGVKPLARDARVRLVKEALSEEQQTGRRLAAEGEESVANPLVDEGCCHWILGSSSSLSAPVFKMGCIVNCA